MKVEVTVSSAHKFHYVIQINSPVDMPSDAIVALEFSGGTTWSAPIIDKRAEIMAPRERAAKIEHGTPVRLVYRGGGKHVVCGSGLARVEGDPTPVTPRCGHFDHVPVEVSGEAVAHLCLTCDEQLPADWS